MVPSQKVRKSPDNKESEEEETETLFDAVHGTRRERIVLQRLIVISRLPCGLADRTKVGAHYEKLTFQLNKQHKWDHVTGLLLIYPSCVLHVVESSGDVLVSVLKDLNDMQRQPDGAVLEAPKVAFMAHNPASRLFQQWSYQVLEAEPEAKRLEEEEQSTETLVCVVLSALHKLAEHLELSKKAPPGSALPDTPELIVPQKVINKLLARDELQTPQEHLQMYNSPLNINTDITGQAFQSSCLTRV